MFVVEASDGVNEYISVCVWNHGQTPVNIKQGDPVAYLVFFPTLQDIKRVTSKPTFEVVSSENIGKQVSWNLSTVEIDGDRDAETDRDSPFFTFDM
jgi:hypothetical protein